MPTRTAAIVIDNFLDNQKWNHIQNNITEYLHAGQFVEDRDEIYFETISWLKEKLKSIVDENGKQESILQSELSIKIADEMNKELFDKYFQEQETLQADKDPLFKKVKNRLKSVIDYPDKPAQLGYPNDPPPEMINGWHPEYGQKGAYYDKLDPQSADAMPATGNPEIDAKVRRAKTLKKVLNKKS